MSNIQKNGNLLLRKIKDDNNSKAEAVFDNLITEQDYKDIVSFISSGEELIVNQGKFSAFTLIRHYTSA